MAALVREGYLDKEHSSAGRRPTTMGLRTYLEELLEDEEELDVVSKTKLQQQFHSSRFSREELIRRALKVLTEVSGNASIALVDQEVYYAGLSEMLNVPEFQELENLRRIMAILEDYATLSNMFNMSRADSEVKILIGSEETGLETFANCAVIFSELRLHSGKKGYIAVIGPNRMPYQRIIPAVKYVAATIGNVVKGW